MPHLQKGMVNWTFLYKQIGVVLSAVDRYAEDPGSCSEPERMAFSQAPSNILELIRAAYLQLGWLEPPAVIVKPTIADKRDLAASIKRILRVFESKFAGWNDAPGASSANFGVITYSTGVALADGMLERFAELMGAVQGLDYKEKPAEPVDWLTMLTSVYNWVEEQKRTIS